MASDDVTLIHGDCLEAMAAMDAGSVDAVVCDPPYGLEFMGKEWDKFQSGQSARWDGKKNAKTRTGRIANKDMTLVSYGKDTRGTKCSICGHYKFSGTPCKCEHPVWEVRTGTPPNMAAYQSFAESWATEALRVLKPSHYLLAFGGTLSLIHI